MPVSLIAALDLDFHEDHLADRSGSSGRARRPPARKYDWPGTMSFGHLGLGGLE